jgi:hypothetical protein
MKKLVLVAIVLFAAACSNERTAPFPTCPDGLKYNPVTKQCIINPAGKNISDLAK